jgi:predicted amidohydrolase
MIVAAFQGPVAFGNPEANFETTLKALEQAQAKGADILVMPESFLHGYFVSIEKARENSVDLGGEFFAGLLERLKDYETTLLLGLNERRGDKLFNTVVVIESGRLVGKYSKNFLVFDYFSRGHQFPVFHKCGIRYGIVICADTSHVEAARILAMKGAQLICAPHFNYIRYGNLDDHTRRVRQHHVAMALDNDVYVVRANVVVPESQGSRNFGYAGVGVGDSFILDNRGRPLAEAGLANHALLVHELNDGKLKASSRPWRRVSPEIARALCKQYERLACRKDKK